METPKIRVVWIRGRGKKSAKLEFERPNTFLGLGLKDSGKSSLLEVIGTKYPRIIDIFGSRDNEGLAWLRCPFFSKNEILLVTGDSVELKARWDVLKMRNFTLAEMEKYRVIISVCAFYSDMDEEFRSLNELIYKNLYRRTYWKELYYLLIREASNFLYSRVKITRNQTIAKNDFIYLLRESRHVGCANGCDTIRWTSLDKEVRDVADFTFVKRVGNIGLPRDLRYVYRYIEPMSMMDCHQSVFVVISNRGHIGLGNFEYPSWHKKEQENLLQTFRIVPEYGEIPDYGDDARNTVNDFEHADIIIKRIDGVNVAGSWKKGTIRRIGDTVGRSTHTVHTHIKEHNQKVRRFTFCDRCRRIKSPYARSVTDAPREFATYIKEK